MAYFTESNAEGFTTEQMDEMNRAIDILAAKGFADTENHISDFINNAFTGNDDAEYYVAAYLEKVS